MPNCYSNTPYGYQDLDHPSWKPSFEAAPENSFHNTIESEPPYHYDENATPISYPKISAFYRTSGPSTLMFQSPSLQEQQANLINGSLPLECLSRQEATNNHSTPHGQLSAFHIGNQSEKPEASTNKSMDTVHSSRSPRFKPGQPSETRYSCGWQGCSYAGRFKSEATLMRHISSIHVSPNKFKCEYCGKRLNRKDRYQAHIQMVHLAKGKPSLRDAGIL